MVSWHLIFKLDSHMVQRNVHQPHVSLLLSTIACQLTPTAVLTFYILKIVLDFMSHFLFVSQKFLKLMSEFVYDIQYKCPQYE